MIRPDVIVIGGGIVGTWSAMEMQQRGIRVCLIDRDEIGAGASSGNCGYVCPSHVMPLHGPGVIQNTLRQLIRPGGALSVPPRWDPALWAWMIRFARNCNADSQAGAAVARHALLKVSRDAYQTFARDYGSDLNWRTDGLLLVFANQKSFDAYGKSVDRLRSEFGLVVDSYDGTSIQDLDRSLRDGLAGGYHFPDDAHLSPGNLMETLRTRFIDLGGDVMTGTRVKEIIAQQGRVSAVKVESGQTLSADHFVLATGAEAPLLVQSLGIPLSITPGKGYSLSIPTHEVHPKIPMIFEDSHVAVTPLGDEFRIGSTMQLTGYDSSISPKRMNLLWQSAEDHLRDFRRVPTTRIWSGWRPMSSDGLPYIGRAAKWKNLIIAAGNGMIGIATGSGTGRLVADLMTNQTPLIDPHPYRVDRPS